jgi:hypothetical protein
LTQIKRTQEILSAFCVEEYGIGRRPFFVENHLTGSTGILLHHPLARLRRTSLEAQRKAEDPFEIDVLHSNGHDNKREIEEIIRQDLQDKQD